MNIKNLIIASRPKTLIASLSPMCMGTAMALSEHKFSFWVFLLTFLTGLGIQISTNFANDLFDFLKGADTSERKGPIRVTQSGLMSISQVKLATFCIMGATALCGTLLILRGGMIIGLLVALALLLAVGYTTGPFPLAYLGIAEIFILIFFGPIATGFTHYLQTLSFSGKAFLAGISPGLISCSLLVVNNLRDIAEDKTAKKKTLVARFGTRFGKMEYAAALIIACTLPLFLVQRHQTLLLTLICFAPASILIQSVWKNENPYAYNPLLGKTGKLLTLFTFIFSLGYLL